MKHKTLYYLLSFITTKLQMKHGCTGALSITEPPVPMLPTRPTYHAVRMGTVSRYGKYGIEPSFDYIIVERKYSEGGWACMCDDNKRLSPGPPPQSAYGVVSGSFYLFVFCVVEHFLRMLFGFV